MKKSAILLLLLPIVLILSIGFVAAQTAGIGFFFGVFGLDSGVGWEILVINIVVFIMLALAFADILSGFTVFSTPVSWAIGIGLAVIGILTGSVKVLAILLLQIGAGLGVISVFIAIASAFIAFALIHIGPIHWLKKALDWAKARQEGLEAFKSTEKVKTGFRTLKEVGKEASKR
jgi:hypothetical protein